MDLKHLVLLIAMPSVLAMNVSIEGTFNIGEELLDSLADRFLSSLGNSRRMMSAQDDRITLMVRYSLFKITKNCENCALYIFIQEYIIVLAIAMGRLLNKSLGSKFIEADYEKQVKEYVDFIKKVLRDSIDDPLHWIAIVKIINSKFQELTSVYEDADVDKNDFRHKIVQATVVMENNYLSILCVEHGACLTTVKFSSALLEVLVKLTNAPHVKTNSFLDSFYKASFRTKFYSLMDPDFANQVQIRLYEFVESPKRGVLKGFQKIVEEHVNQSVTEKQPRHVELIRAILSDLDIIYVVVASGPFTDFLQVLYVFLNNNMTITSDITKLLLGIQKVVSALASEFFNKLYNQVQVLLNIILSADY